MKCSIISKDIFTPKQILGETFVLIEDDLIVDVRDKNENGYTPIDLRNYKVIPGLIDMHIHGINGYDTMDGSLVSMDEISRCLASFGVTSFLATTVTASFEKIESALENVKKCRNTDLSGARLLGTYVEGPYICAEFKGAHPAPFIREININEIEKLISVAGDALVVMTIAPEKQNAIDAIEFLRKNNIKVALGHTNATYEQTIAALDAGATIITHLFNGMRGLNHRETGIVGAALTDNRAYVELICDLIHVSSPILKLTQKCKENDKVVLITDCIMAACLKDGQYRLGELDIFVKDGVSRLENGVLAGSTLKLLDAVKNMSEKGQIDFENALGMATINPAIAIGKEASIGSITKGKKADIVALNDNFEPVFVMVGGEIKIDKTRIFN